MSYLIALSFLAILASLAAAGLFMLRGGRKSEDEEQAKPDKRMANALTVRIALSVLIFICILVAWKFGLIQPTGIR